jgi:hypothetical protein
MIGLGLALGLRSGGGGAAPPAAKTYADFQAHIATLATDGAGSWSADMALLTDANHAYRITAAAAVGSMYGTPWNSAFALNAGTLCRVIQHGLPSAAVFNEQTADGREIFVRTVPVSNRVLPDFVSRNGYTTRNTDGVTETRATQCTELIYWDGTQAQRMQPSLGLGPTPYDWVIP